MTILGVSGGAEDPRPQSADLQYRVFGDSEEETIAFYDALDAALGVCDDAKTLAARNPVLREPPLGPLPSECSPVETVCDRDDRRV